MSSKNWSSAGRSGSSDERPAGAGVKWVVDVLRDLGDAIRDDVVAACEKWDRERNLEALAQVTCDDEGDTQYAIDDVAESRIVAALEPVAREEPIVLVAEGLSGGVRVLPEGANAAQARWRVIIDPIDGTRGLMYQKRSAWVLAAVAPNRGPTTSLQDIVAVVQTEIPLVKQHLTDRLTWRAGEPVIVRRFDRVAGEDEGVPIELRPSRATSIEHGFAAISRFFPGVRDELAAIDEEVVDAVLGPPVAGKARCFEDQYLSTGGQLYELMAGHDRFVADLRPLMMPLEQRRGRPSGIACHPYDICSAPMAAAAGVVITRPDGGPLNAPLDVTTDVAWVGYANEALRRQVEPALQAALRRRGLL